MEGLTVHGSPKETKLYICNSVHYKKAFEPAEAMLIKTKMQHVICIESKGISKNSENSEGFLPEDGGICANPKILCLTVNSSIWNSYKRPILEARALWRATERCLALLNRLLVL